MEEKTRIMNWIGKGAVDLHGKAERSEPETGIYRVCRMCCDTTSWMGKPETNRNNKS